MRRWTRKIVVVFVSGYILFFYSERMFWSFLRPRDKVAEILITWVVYSILAWVVLLLVRQCRIAAFPAVFLAGAVFGWLAEGIVVDTMYGNADNPFPMSISFTGLAWHASISVGVGWYCQAKVLTGGKFRSIALFSTVVGAGWGLWAGWWPAELGAENASFTAFAAHTLVCFLPLAGAWMVLGLAGSEWFRPAKWELPILLGVIALFFVGLRVLATPRSALILPPLLLACAYGLRRNLSQEPRPDLLEAMLGHIQPRSCLPLVLMPATAIAVYAPVAFFGLKLPTNWVLYLITMPLGFIFLIRSLWVLHRGKSERETTHMAISLDEIVPWGRSRREYELMFDLGWTDLSGGVLDCGGGPSIFTAELSESGIRAVSVDPIYVFPGESHPGHALRPSMEPMIAQVQRHAQRLGVGVSPRPG